MEDKDADFLKRLLETFKTEAAEHIAAISSGLIELEEAAPNMQAPIIERVFRESHSMKGAARAVNLSTIETLCQSFEDVLSALKRKQVPPEGEIMDLLHRSVNILGALISSVGEKGKFPGRAGIRDLLRDFEGIMKRAAPAPAASQSGYEAHLKAPGTPLTPAGTVRVSKRRLDSVLLQTEGLLSAKQSVSQRAAELREIMAMTGSFKKDLAKILPGIPDEFSRLHDSLLNFEKALEADRRSLAGMVDGLMDDVKTISMLPFSSILDLMPKVVRDLAHDQGKEAAFSVSGAEIEIDRRILDEIREPLIHLLRNSIDHGIEKRRERLAGKKDPVGSVRIDIAQKEGKTVEVAVSDDGAGIDLGKVRDSALRLGVLSREEAGKANEQKLLSLMFRSGVTTSPIITDISGRGLGLAIVQEKVEKLGGAVFCEPAGAAGAAFRILLPLTLATFRGVLVRAAGQLFIVPLMGLDRTVRVKRDDIRTVENRETVIIDGQTVPLLPLRQVLEIPVAEKATGAKFLQAAVLGAAGRRIAFGVDEVLHEQEVLVKNMGEQLVRVRNVLGAAVLGSGRVVTILNVADLLKSALKIAPATPAPAETEGAPAARKSILVVEDSITARALLKNILEAAGYDVKTAVDGIDALTMLKTEQFDLAVSDVDMPRMNGLDLTAKVRADQRLSGLPVVLVTALESREDRERGIDVGANAYIVKSSFDQSNLLEVIRRLI
ncbi:MAG: response regulator [Nitrospiraceae bacterium]|nr:response regulator [Nitrospiraceae bacterium]